MSADSRLFKLFDRYDVLARMVPGALSVLIPLAGLLMAFPDLVAGNPLRAAGSGVVVVALSYLFINLARSRGRAIQEKLKRAWGGMPTEILLRHRDVSIEAPTKLAYHKELQKLAPDLALPDAAAEAAQPALADDLYRAAVRRLIEKRRDKKYYLILNDNIAYGFWRNLLGMRNISSVIGVCAMAAVLVSCMNWPPMNTLNGWFTAMSFAPLKLAALGFLALWEIFLFAIVRSHRVWDSGVAFAERLLASLPAPSMTTRTRRSRKAAPPEV